MTEPSPVASPFGHAVDTRAALLLSMTLVFSTIVTGCATSSLPWQGQQPNFGNPWTNPAGAGPTLPPPTGLTPAQPQLGAVPGGGRLNAGTAPVPGNGLPGNGLASGSPYGANPGTLPAVPALPPPTGNRYAVPGAGGFDSPPIARTAPSLTNPGTIQQQQARASQFDPYADNRAAPEIVGGRPREFQKPLAEPVRPRGFRDTRWPF